MTLCQAQYNPFLIEARGTGPRAGRMEFYGVGQFSSLQDFERRNVTVNHPEDGLVRGDIRFQFEDSWEGGIGLGYHLNNYFALNAEFVMGSMGYQANFRESRLKGTMLQSTGKFNVDYNILAQPFTPFVSAGLGYHYQDTGVPSGPPDYYCWWDYFWGGWVCTGYTPTHTDTYFTLNAQAGLRWDVNDFVFAKVWGGASWLNVGRGAGWPANLQANLALGLKF